MRLYIVGSILRIVLSFSSLSFITLLCITLILTPPHSLFLSPTLPPLSLTHSPNTERICTTTRHLQFDEVRTLASVRTDRRGIHLGNGNCQVKISCIGRSGNSLLLTFIFTVPPSPLGDRNMMARIFIIYDQF